MEWDVSVDDELMGLIIISEHCLVMLAQVAHKGKVPSNARCRWLNGVRS